MKNLALEIRDKYAYYTLPRYEWNALLDEKELDGTPPTVVYALLCGAVFR